MKRRPLGNNSAFFRRIVSLLLGALILSALFTFLFYSFAANLVFTNIKTKEYTEHASFLAEKTALRYLGGLSPVPYDSLMEASPELTDATVIVYMYRESSFDIAYTSERLPLDSEEIEEAKALITEHNYALMERKVAAFEEEIGEEEDKYLFVGYPIVVSNPYSQTRQTVGAVYIVGSFDTIRESYTSLNFALILSSCIAFLLMLFPVLLVTSRLLLPLVETKNVALAMTRGDFSKRAKADSKDEIGDLAKAINNLADDLDRTLNSLMAERNRLQQILNGLGEGILAVSDQMGLMHINPALLRLFSVEEQNDREAFRHILAEGELEEKFRHVLSSKESVALNLKQRSRIIAVQIDPLLDSQEEVYGAVALFRDTTEAEQLEQTRRDYVSNVSHELRTPLTAVRGLVEPLADGMVKKEEDRQRYYGIILRETLRLSRLIDDMMTLSRLQAGALEVEAEIIDPHELSESMNYKYRRPMEEKGIRFIVPDPEEELPLLYVNADRVEQILVILLDNAMKFTKAGGTIEIRLAPYPRSPERWQFIVKDSGTGIAAEDQDFIFERFYKVNKSRGRSEGTGLGLSIAKELCEQMGESIWVRSKAGEGSEFHFSVKTATEEDKDV